MAYDQTAWECDMAETYGIIDLDRIPVRKLATLSAGLRSDSRIISKMNGSKVAFRDLMIAGMYDIVSLLFWSKTTDAQRNINRPPSILEKLLNRKKERDDVVSFESGKEFEEARRKILSKIKEE